MKKTVVLILFIAGAISHVRAQSGWNLMENAIWNFADSLGLDFTGGSPDTFSSNVPTLSPNCSATISDPDGNMLFYTTSATIWDRNGTPMPGGGLEYAPLHNPDGTLSDKVGAGSNGAPQGVIILPVINNPKQYYVFTLAGWVFDENAGGPPSYMWLTYTIVDMSLNNGLGAVSTPPTIIDSFLSCHMTAVPGNDCNIWLLVHAKKQPTFKAYEITAAGISASPVISTAGYTPIIDPDLGNTSHGYGSMQLTSDRRKLAYVSPIHLFPDDFSGRTELFDFDAATGIVSNEMILDSAYSWDLAISPDNSKLYTSSCSINWDDQTGFSPFYQLLYQFDISLPTASAIAASRVLIDTIKTPVVTMPLRLTRDGKIYYNRSNSVTPGDAGYLGAIQQPNLPGLACNNVQHAVLMPSRTYPDDTRSGIGCNGFVRPTPGDTVYQHHDTVICANETMVLNTPDAIYHLWSNGETDTAITITTPGIYWAMSAVSYCELVIDSFVVTDCITGIREGHETNAVSIYPNPAEDLFNCEVRLNRAADVAITVRDMYGRVASERQYGSLDAGVHLLQHDIAMLPGGMYMVTVRINKERTTLRLLKK